MVILGVAGDGTISAEDLVFLNHFKFRWKIGVRKCLMSRKWHLELLEVFPCGHTAHFNDELKFTTFP